MITLRVMDGNDGNHSERNGPTGGGAEVLSKIEWVYWAAFTHESFNVTVRLNTGAPGFVSTRSATK